MKNKNLLKNLDTSLVLTLVSILSVFVLAVFLGTSLTTKGTYSTDLCTAGERSDCIGVWDESTCTCSTSTPTSNCPNKTDADVHATCASGYCSDIATAQNGCKYCGKCGSASTSTPDCVANPDGTGCDSTSNSNCSNQDRTECRNNGWTFNEINCTCKNPECENIDRDYCSSVHGVWNESNCTCKRTTATPTPTSTNKPSGGDSEGNTPTTEPTTKPTVTPTVKPSSSDNTDSNPKTGTVGIAIAWFAGLFALITSFFYFKRSSEL